MSKPKQSRPTEIDGQTQLWHGLVDTLRRLPSVTSSSTDKSQELLLAQREKATLDDAFEQINTLLRLKRSEMGGAVPDVQVIRGTRADSPLAAGIKRKREKEGGGRRVGESTSPAPQSQPVETLTIPSLAPNHHLPRGATTPHSAAPSPRGGTPMSRQLTDRERKDQLSEQLPLQPRRRILCKQPRDKKSSAADDEEDAWILGYIVNCIGGDKNRYTVQDADDSTDTKFNTTLRSIIPLPDASLPLNSSSHPSNIPDFPRNARILAFYPTTTSFYPADVKSGPFRVKPKSGGPVKKVYTVFFDGDQEETTGIEADDMVLMPNNER